MSQVPPPAHVTVHPEPSEDELAAIVAAYQQLWPAPADDTASAAGPRRWKFQGRWWSDQPSRAPATGWR